MKPPQRLTSSVFQMNVWFCKHWLGTVTAGMFLGGHFWGFGHRTYLPVLYSTGQGVTAQIVLISQSCEAKQQRARGRLQKSQKNTEREIKVITNCDYNCTDKRYLQLIIFPNHKE